MVLRAVYCLVRPRRICGIAFELSYNHSAFSHKCQSGRLTTAPRDEQNDKNRCRLSRAKMLSGPYVPTAASNSL